MARGNTPFQTTAQRQRRRRRRTCVQRQRGDKQNNSFLPRGQLRSCGESPPNLMSKAETSLRVSRRIPFILRTVNSTKAPFLPTEPVKIPRNFHVSREIPLSSGAVAAASRRKRSFLKARLRSYKDLHEHRHTCVVLLHTDVVVVVAVTSIPVSCLLSLGAGLASTPEMPSSALALRRRKSRVVNNGSPQQPPKRERCAEVAPISCRWVSHATLDAPRDRKGPKRKRKGGLG